MQSKAISANLNNDKQIMERHQAQAIGDIISTYLRESGLEKPLLERRIVEQWGTIMGKTIANLTSSVEVDKGVLKVRLTSAALRAELFNCRFELVKKVNEAVGADVIRDVRLYG